MTAAWGFSDRATQQRGEGEGSEGWTEKGRVLPWFAVGLFVVAYIGHLLCSFAREEGAMRAHNGCARFCGDEWNADRRYSIQPRALLPGRESSNPNRPKFASSEFSNFVVLSGNLFYELTEFELRRGTISTRRAAVSALAR